MLTNSEGVQIRRGLVLTNSEGVPIRKGLDLVSPEGSFLCQSGGVLFY